VGPPRAHNLAKDPRSSSRNFFSSRSSSTIRRLLCSLAILTFVCGCKKKEERLTAAKIHAITREFAAAASSAALAGGNIRSELRAADGRPGAGDHLYITARAETTEAVRRAALARMLQSFSSVATGHGLTQDPIVESGGSLRLNYRYSGTLTHSIHIFSPIAVARPGSSPQGKGSVARLAIILDDLGNDRAAADAIFALPYPLTLSVLPNQPHSASVAEEAERRGYQVMLHLPMQPVAGQKAEPVELRPGLSQSEVASVLDGMLNSLPSVVGVNNHQGSQATADRQLMSELMRLLRERNLFYVDSRTTSASVAYDTAQRFGVRTAFRNVPFLDDVAEVTAVRAQLQQAVRGARAKGEAITIGHAHAATLQALREALPQLEAQGVRLVFASELVH
jgi:polysaccharide deacetylase 2 family uncharacterized protein YibQ/predicted nucleic acid-binding protein